MLPRELAALRKFVGLALQVSYVESARVQYRSTVERPADQGNGEGHGRDRAVMSDEQEPIAVPPEDLGIRRLAQTGGALRHRVEHRLDVGRRATAHAQDLARRLLTLQALRQALLQVTDPGVVVL